MTTATPTVSVVIPVFRAERTLNELYERLVAEMAGINLQFEIIFIEDGGADGSWPIIVDLARADPRVRGIRMSRNYGQHNALLCGIRAARYEVVVTLDDDLQHPVDEIPSLLAALDQGHDIVYGVPRAKRHGLWRNIGSALIRGALAGSMGWACARHVSAFRAFRTRLRDGFQDYRAPSVFIDILLNWSSQRVAAVTVNHAPREVGTSGYTLPKLIRLTLVLATGFSTRPLRLVGLIGLVLLLGGLVWLLILAALDHAGGLVLLAAIITIMSGVQLCGMGVLGEYLASVHSRSMDRPAYLVMETTAGAAPAFPWPSGPIPATRDLT